MTRSNVVPPKNQIPEFASREEEASFWDTHDLTDYFDFTEPVEIEVACPLSEPVTLHIDLETMEEVRVNAEEQDLPPDGLIHVWILERRDAERQRRAAATARPPGSVRQPDPSADGTAPEPPRESTA